jgi:RNA polymerase sigma-70 factor (ECF subfamily)
MPYAHSLTLASIGRDGSCAPTSDTALLAAIASGDKRALRMLYGRHHVRVFRFLVRLTNDAATAEELLSDVFLDVWRQAGRFEGRSQVSTWLIGIARNKALSVLRRRTTEPLDDEAAALIEDPADNPEVALGKRETSSILENCLIELSVAHREIIDLVYYHGRTIDEVAEILGVPQNTVKTRMFYARKRLAELLAAKGVERMSEAL